MQPGALRCVVAGGLPAGLGLHTRMSRTPWNFVVAVLFDDQAAPTIAASLVGVISSPIPEQARTWGSTHPCSW
jgi:hypothetical protein